MGVATLLAVVVVGLTGGIGAGKSTVAAMFAAKGAKVIDVDGLGRAVIEPDGPAYPAVVERYGPQVVGQTGEIDRRALSAIVFGDPAALADLNAITHPAITAEVARGVAQAAADVVVILDMAVLVEAPLAVGPDGPLYQKVVVVEAPVEVRLARLAERGLSRQEALARMDSQASDQQRRAVADIVIDNGNDLGALESAVTAAWDLLGN
jgi:dephospho-CoA kinase